MGGPWDPQAIEGVHRFLQRAWAVVTEDVQLDAAAAGGRSFSPTRRRRVRWSASCTRRS
jgi:leucyl-tRNA synthetase